MLPTFLRRTAPPSNLHLFFRTYAGRAAVLDGLSMAAAWTKELAVEADVLRGALGRPPALAIVLVGSRLDSQLYVQRKLEACAKVGIITSVQRLAAVVGQSELEAVVQALSSSAAVDGLIVQLPLPPHINASAVLSTVTPAKDVDGFSPLNLGGHLMQYPASAFTPCAALGCLELLKRSGVNLQGKTAAVLGDSSTVGLPIALALRNSGVGTLTLVTRAAIAPLLASRGMLEPAAPQSAGLAHHRVTGVLPSGRADAASHASSRRGNAAKTADMPGALLAAQTKQADVLVVAVGCAGLVTGDWVKPGATVVDVGINIKLARGAGMVTQVAQGAAMDTFDFGPAGSNTMGGYQVSGDVDFSDVSQVAGAITPVPGGVGPMTVAAVLHNTLQTARLRLATWGRGSIQVQSQ